MAHLFWLSDTRSARIAPEDLRSQRLAAICSEMTAAQDHVTRLCRTIADERVAIFLLDIARRTGADALTPAEADVPFGRLDIADYVGLTVETVRSRS